MNLTFLAATGDGLVRAECLQGRWRVTQPLNGQRVNCLAVDPHDPQRIFAGTQTQGVLLSTDAGHSWQPGGLPGLTVKSLAVSPRQPGLLFAGCKPVSLYVSHDGGQGWDERPALRRARRWWWFSPADPPGWTPYVQALALSPHDPNLLLAGIELGGVLRSTDGGQNWSRHRKGAVLDCHSLRFHPQRAGWVYQGGGGGAAISQDGGLNWRRPTAGLNKTYGWMVAADPARPEVWYLSASRMPNPLRGEFTPPAHTDGKAGASIYRSVGGAAWEPLSGGLPQPLNHMPYALLNDLHNPGHLYAGLGNGDLWHTANYGDHWTQLPVNLGRIHYDLLLLPP